MRSRDTDVRVLDHLTIGSGEKGGRVMREETEADGVEIFPRTNIWGRRVSTRRVGASAVKACQVCGRALAANNRTGICQRTEACRLAYCRKHEAMKRKGLNRRDAEDAENTKLEVGSEK